MEISGAAHLVARPVFAHAAPDQGLTQVHRIEPQTQTQDARSDARDRPEQDSQAAAVRDLIALRRDVAQGKRPAGPPPSFEVSLLEVEADLKQKLARMEAERAQSREADAVQSATEAAEAREAAKVAAEEAAEAASEADAGKDAATPVESVETDAPPSEPPPA